MRPFWALIRKQIVESRWTLVLSAAALFGLGWLFVYVTARTEAEIISRLESGTGGRAASVHADDGGSGYVGFDHDDVLESPSDHAH